MTLSESRIVVPLRYRHIAISVVLRHVANILTSELSTSPMTSFFGGEIVGVMPTPAVEKANAVIDFRIESPSENLAIAWTTVFREHAKF